MKKPNLALIFQ